MFLFAEWSGHMENGPRKRECIDSDDDDEEDTDERLDPLKLMAYHSSSVKRPARQTVQ